MEESRSQETALKQSSEILEEEISDALRELERPTRGLAVSGLTAGFGIGISLLLKAIILTATEGVIPDAAVRLLVANAHTVGFIVVIMGRTDLFTEYTTLALLPVLTGRATVRSLARFWTWIYTANIAGAALFAWMTVWLGPGLGIIDVGVLQRHAAEVVAYRVSVTLLSAVFAGWLMGMLAWLVTSARDTISQVFFIWLLTFVIAAGELHHSISGAVSVLAGAFAGALGTSEVLRFLLLATLGNAVGGIVFAVGTRYQVRLRDS